MTRLRRRNRLRGKQGAMLLLRPAPGNPCQAILQAGPLRVRAAIGRTGRSSRKREGDGATPIGTMRLHSVFYRADHIRLLPSLLPRRPIRADMLWCDDPKNPNYNRLVRGPLLASHERMMRQDRLYDICIVMDWNISMRRRGCGSAIFLHVARPGHAPTDGCVALGRTDMMRLLSLVSVHTRLKVL